MGTTIHPKILLITGDRVMMLPPEVFFYTYKLDWSRHQIHPSQQVLEARVVAEGVEACG
jgi:hypothetical protein